MRDKAFAPLPIGPTLTHKRRVLIQEQITIKQSMSSPSLRLQESGDTALTVVRWCVQVHQPVLLIITCLHLHAVDKYAIVTPTTWPCAIYTLQK